MATRSLTNAEIPALEPIGLEAKPVALRRIGRSWARGALFLDAAMLLAAGLAAEIGASGAGIVRTAPVWLVLYAALVVLILHLRGMYSWHVRLQALDDVRAVLASTGLAAMGLLEHPEFGLQPVGFLDKEPLEEPGLPVPVLGASWDLERIVEQHAIEHLVITFSKAPSEVLLREVKRCEELGVAVFLVPRLFESVTERLSVEHIGGLPLLSARRPDPKGWHFALKYTADRVVAVLILVAAAPLLLVLALGTLVSVGRPVFFRQPRVGLDGRRFEMLKFRSMHATVEPVVLPDLPQDTAPGGVEGNDRRTRFGTFLRRTSLDELPQLLNVLRGDMSLIGPRPERPDFVELFERNVHRYGDRHRVKSGITGWAQVNGLRGKTSLSDRVEWDNYYIENWSLWLDVKILLMTALAVRHYFAQAE